MCLPFRTTARNSSLGSFGDQFRGRLRGRTMQATSRASSNVVSSGMDELALHERYTRREGDPHATRAIGRR
eukprot:7076360-Alexandrium_andersonii.AAC.1